MFIFSEIPLYDWITLYIKIIYICVTLSSVTYKNMVTRNSRHWIELFARRCYSQGTNSSRIILQCSRLQGWLYHTASPSVRIKYSCKGSSICLFGRIIRYEWILWLMGGLRTFCKRCKHTQILTHTKIQAGPKLTPSAMHSFWYLI